jgi:hypothetical protein
VALYARRAKKDVAILCGACGQALGSRYDPWQYEPDEVQWHVFLPSGWTRRDDGVWVLSGHARRDMKRGKALGTDGKPKAYRPSASAPPTDRFNSYVTRPRPGERPMSRLRGWLLTELPAEIVCFRPRCEMRQTLDSDTLDVTAAPVALENDGLSFRVPSKIPGAIFMPDHDRSMKEVRSGRFHVLDKYKRESPFLRTPLPGRKDPPLP